MCTDKNNGNKKMNLALPPSTAVALFLQFHTVAVLILAEKLLII